MHVIKKIALTIVIMLVWGIGKEVAQKLQGSNAGFLTFVVSCVCGIILGDMWIFESFLFSKEKKVNDISVQNNPVNQGYLNTINNISHSMPEKQSNVPVQTHKQNTVKQSESIMNNNEHSEVINEDELYLQATQEVDEGNQDKALWARCMALCEGDEGKAKYKYIKERVEKIAKETMKSLVAFKINKNDAVISEKSINDENDKHVDNLVITFGVVIFLCVAIAMLFFV